MEYFIYDEHNEKIGILQNCESIQWKFKYDETGTFEIHCLETSENLMNLIENNRIIRSDGSTGFIKYVNSEDGKLEVRGYFDNLADRINPTTSQIRSVQSDLYALVNKNKRGLNITTDDISGLAAEIELDTTWDDLRTTFSDVCKKTGYGYRMLKKGNIFNVIQVYNRGKNESVLFSEDIGNIVAESFFSDISDYKNYAYVAGEGEGSDRIVVEINRTSGGNRYELYVDAKDLQKKWTDEDGTEHTYTDDEYKEQLNQRGNTKLDEYKQKHEFTCEIDLTNESFIFGEDYVLGDIVKVKSNKYGFVKWFRISGIDEIEEDGYSVKATLTEWIGE